MQYAGRGNTKEKLTKDRIKKDQEQADKVAHLQVFMGVDKEDSVL